MCCFDIKLWKFKRKSKLVIVKLILFLGEKVFLGFLLVVLGIFYKNICIVLCKEKNLIYFELYYLIIESREFVEILGDFRWYRCYVGIWYINFLKES